MSERLSESTQILIVFSEDPASEGIGCEVRHRNKQKFASHVRDRFFPVCPLARRQASRFSDSLP